MTKTRGQKTRTKWVKKECQKSALDKAHFLGYCHNQVHQGGVTKRMMDAHGCLERHCPFFERYDRPFWKEREKKKEKKKKLRDIEKIKREILETARKTTRDIDNFAFLSIEYDGRYLVRYVVSPAVRLNVHEILSSIKYSENYKVSYIRYVASQDDIVNALKRQGKFVSIKNKNKELRRLVRVLQRISEKKAEEDMLSEDKN